MSHETFGDDDLPPSTTEQLAASLGLEVRELVEAFGAGWRLLPSSSLDEETGPICLRGFSADWHVAGEPFQIALRLLDDGVELAPPVVADLLKRRRAGFRYCRYCRRLTPPEERLSAQVCHGCGSRWMGLIY